MARHRLPAKLRALGDSATNEAFALLKPQFSPTRNAPLEGHCRVAAPFPATLPKRRFHEPFSRQPAQFAPFLTRLKQHVRRLAQDIPRKRRFGGKRIWTSAAT